MSFDQIKLGKLAAEMMDTLEQDYGDDCEIGDAVLICEILGPHGSTVSVRMTQPRRHVNLGLMEVARRAVENDSAPG